MSYQSEVLADSPIAYWRLGESSVAGAGAVKDASGNARHATATNITPGVAGLVTGDADTAFSFNGSNSMAQITGHAAWMNQASFSIDAIFKTNTIAASQWQEMLSRYGSSFSNAAFGFRMDPLGKLSAYIFSGASYTPLLSTATLAANTKYHVAMTLDGSINQVKLYINGALDSTLTVSPMNVLTPAQNIGITIGARSDNTENFNGTLDEVAYYPTVLSAARIQAHYIESIGGPQPPVLATPTAAQSAATTLRLTWGASTNGFPATSHDVRIDGGTPTTGLSGSTTSYDFTGLTLGTSHLLEVRGVNSAGASAWVGATAKVGTLYLYDDFNRANSTTVLGGPVTGGPYTTRTGTFGILNNQMYTAGATSNAHVTFPAAINVDIQVTVPVIFENVPGPIVRWVDASNYWYLSISSGRWWLAHMAAGIPTNFGPGGPTAVNGDVVRVLTLGRSMYVYVNGKLCILWDDQFFNVATTTAGLRLSGSTVVRYDELVVTEATTVPGDGATAQMIDDIFGTDYDLVGAVYKGRDTAAADAGSVA